jgi:hypothetical protein
LGFLLELKRPDGYSISAEIEVSDPSGSLRSLFLAYTREMGVLVLETEGG